MSRWDSYHSFVLKSVPNKFSCMPLIPERPLPYCLSQRKFFSKKSCCSVIGKENKGLNGTSVRCQKAVSFMKI